MNKLTGIVIVILALVGWAGEASAQLMSNGYACAPKNIGGEDTRLFFRQQDGVAINLSQTATFPVVCPVVIDYYTWEGSYGVGVTLKNGSSSTQTFSCALEEYRGDGVRQRSIGRSVNIRPGGYDFFNWEVMQVVTDFNYSSLRCILPPKGMIAELAWF
jgi:hypothetical protein